MLRSVLLSNDTWAVHLLAGCVLWEHGCVLLHSQVSADPWYPSVGGVPVLCFLRIWLLCLYHGEGWGIHFSSLVALKSRAGLWGLRINRGGGRKGSQVFLGALPKLRVWWEECVWYLTEHQCGLQCGFWKLGDLGWVSCHFLHWKRFCQNLERRGTNPVTQRPSSICFCQFDIIQ